MAATALISVVLRIHTVITGGNLVGAYLLPTYRMDGFMLGGIIAILYTKDHQLAWVNTRTLNWVIALFTTIFLAMSYHSVGLCSKFATAYAYVIYAVFFALILLRVLKGGTFAWLSKGPLAYVGTISYSVYLFHFPIVYAMSYACLNRIPVTINFILTVGICLMISTISWYWMEKKLIARGKAINERIVEKKPFQLVGMVWQF
jgi:peptidoglycan/LPS O-acetylase OafA/YrhL